MATLKGTITLSLDKNKMIKNLGVDKLHKYADEIVKARTNALKELEQRVVDKLLENMVKYGIESLNILGSIRTTRSESGLTLRVGTPYAIFIEYGTGIVGSENPHPHLIAGWTYKNDGWWYPTDETTQERYPMQLTTTIDGDLYAYTKGLPSRPFMYDTYLWATRSASPILRKHVNRIKLD